MRAFVSVSSVVNVFDETMNSVSSGSRSRVASQKSVPSTFDTKRNVIDRSAEVAQRLVGHRGPRSVPPMPMLTTLRIRLPVCPVHAPDADPVGEVGHLVEHRVHLGHDVVAVDHDPLVLGARSATCSTARSSVTLIFSPANIASRSCSTPARRASATSSAIVSSVSRFFE